MTAAAFFVAAGLSTVFLILGLAASAFGRMFSAYQREMALVGGVVIVLFGLHFSRRAPDPAALPRGADRRGRSGGTPFGAYLLGLAFASAGRPASAWCSAPS